MRPLRVQSARVVAAGHAFVQNIRRGPHELATDEPAHDRLRIAFDALSASVWNVLAPENHPVHDRLTQQRPLDWVAHPQPPNEEGAHCGRQLAKETPRTAKR